MQDVRTAAIKFLNQNDHAVDITLVDFDTEVRVARFGANDYPRLIEPIRRRKPAGLTALYDALASTCAARPMQDGQKILVAYTDGGDTRSTHQCRRRRRPAEGLGRHALCAGLPGAPVELGPERRADGAAAVRRDDRRPGVLPVQRQGARRDLREDRSAR